MNYNRFWKKAGEGQVEVKVKYRWQAMTGDLDKDVSDLGTNKWKIKTCQFNRVALLS